VLFRGTFWVLEMAVHFALVYFGIAGVVLMIECWITDIYTLLFTIFS